MSQEIERRIILEFDREILDPPPNQDGAIVFNKNSFSVKGREYEHTHSEATHEVEYPIVSVERYQNMKNQLILLLDPIQRFNNVEGQLTIIYDAGHGGTLTGLGDPVESFEYSFTPTGLEVKSDGSSGPKPNPFVDGRVCATLRATVDFIEVQRSDAFSKGGQERVVATPSATVDFIEAEDIGVEDL